eukprot:1136713-Pelagomonas_calceolata.AAC.8
MAPWLPSGSWEEESVGGEGKERIGFASQGQLRAKGERKFSLFLPTSTARKLPTAGESRPLAYVASFSSRYGKRELQSFSLYFALYFLLLELSLPAVLLSDRDVPHPNGRPPKVRGGALWVGGFLAARASRGLRIRRKTT